MLKEDIISHLDITSCPLIYFYKNSEKIKSVYGTYENSFIFLLNSKAGNRYCFLFHKSVSLNLCSKFFLICQTYCRSRKV